MMMNPLDSAWELACMANAETLLALESQLAGGLTGIL